MGDNMTQIETPTTTLVKTSTNTKLVLTGISAAIVVVFQLFISIKFVAF
jgi:hypothetical protein